MKKALIVQSLPEWHKILNEAISQKLPELAEYILSTNSFDHALTIVPKNGPFIAFISNMYHDSFSEYRSKVKQHIPDNEKNGSRLAQMIKEINPEAIIFSWSEYPPIDWQYLDGSIPKDTAGINTIIALLGSLVFQKDIIE